MHRDLKIMISQKANELGFDLVGFCKGEYSPTDHDHLLQWLRHGHHGAMTYMAREPRQRSDPRLLVDDVRTVISLGVNYYKEPGYREDRPYISIYARGEPYQKVIRPRLKRLFSFIQEHVPDARGKVAVDTSPTFDKLWAQKAGLGWRGKNTLIINRKLGSFTFLGEVFLNLEIEPDDPVKDHCADCRKCLDACPTGAIIEPYMLDATKCISYLTIEAGPQAPNRHLVGNHLFGCDLCQLACPYNRALAPTKWSELLPKPQFDPDFEHDWLNLTEPEFKNRYSGTIIYDNGFNNYERNAKNLTFKREGH